VTIFAGDQTDARRLKEGRIIPSGGYCDQPYVVKNSKGEWLCVMTTGEGEEGDRDQHIVATISSDRGETWTPLIDIEPMGPPESSWVTPFATASGRIYVFYTYNGSNMERVIARYEWAAKRVDTLGDFVYKYSDDGGYTWSKERYTIPVRNFTIDLQNPYGGSVQFFWSVCKPIIHKDAVYIGLAKVGRFGDGFMESSEGAFVRSRNLLHEQDPAKVVWETLPDGADGLRAPSSDVADEHNLVSLSDGSLYCTYRTIEGHNCHAYSRDDGHTWTPPEHAVYSPNGRKIKHPRAANFVRKFKNGKYLLWFHNNGRDWSKDMTPELQSVPYQYRNPVWISGGVERDGYIHWSQPEIVLYDEEASVRISYPDFVEEDDGQIYITETQKVTARVHRVDMDMLHKLWNQSCLREVSTDGLLISWERESQQARGLAWTVSAEQERRSGFTIEMWISFDTLLPGETIIQSQAAPGQGFVVRTGDKNTVSITLNDGTRESVWDCDPEQLVTGKRHHLAIIIDQGPRLISFVIDGVLCDGGPHRQFGFTHYDTDLQACIVSGNVTLHPEFSGVLHTLRVYNRHLLVSEAVSHYHAG